MLNLTVKPDSVKSFMNKLLKGEDFDRLEVRNLDVLSFTLLQINGELTEKVESNYCCWSELKGFVMAFLKGHSRPRMFKLVLSYPKPIELHANGAAMFLNIMYEQVGEETHIRMTTAVSQKVFALDKSLDGIWDGWVRKFFDDKPDYGVIEED